MANIERYTVSITTETDGSATAYTDVPVNGYLESIQYVKDDFTDGVDFTITTETTGLTLWTETNVNAAKTVLPRAATTDTAGAASLYAAGGEPVEARIAIASERVKIVIASGGNTTGGTFYVTVS